MKFLVDNYTSHSQTEAYYIHSILNMIDGCKSHFTDRSISFYDSCDMIDPDIIIAHARNVTSDVLSYLKDNPSKNLVLNLSGMTSDNFKNMNDAFKDENINCSIYFTNHPAHNINTRRQDPSIVTILPGADTLFTPSVGLSYNIDQAIIGNKSKSRGVEKLSGTYHYISTYPKQADEVVDIHLPAIHMPNILKNYKKIIFKPFMPEEGIPQVFFDSIYYGQNVAYEPDDSDNALAMDRQLQKIFKLDVPFSKYQDFNEIKNLVMKKHTCFNRVKSLLSQLSCKDTVDKLGILMGNIS